MVTMISCNIVLTKWRHSKGKSDLTKSSGTSNVTVVCLYRSPCFTWWRHQMETFSALLAICAGNSPGTVNSPHKGQWRGTLMFTLICARINGWVNNREAGDLRRYRTHYDVIVMRTVGCHVGIDGNACRLSEIKPTNILNFKMIIKGTTPFYAYVVKCWIHRHLGCFLNSFKLTANIVKAPLYWSFVKEIRRWLVGFSDEIPVM